MAQLTCQMASAMYAAPAPSIPNEMAIPALHPDLNTPEYRARIRGSLVLRWSAIVSYKATHMLAMSHCAKPCQYA